MSDYIIEMLGITKSFPGILANDGISLQLKKGEIHALLGENGAGKSTLMSILFGLYEPDKGEIRKNGKKITLKSPNDATRYGIGMVHQHFRLVGPFTVLDNIILGSEDTSLGILRRSASREKIKELCRKYDLEIDLDAKAEDISVGMQQRLEIIKMLYRENEILIFDEPTAVLTPMEARELIKTMRELCRQGKSVLFITHKLEEIMECADRVTVLRKGRAVATRKVCETDKNELSSLMVGRSVELKVKKKKAQIGERLLQVTDLCVPSRLHKGRLSVKHVSFKLHRGEILCIAGIDSNGQSELVGGITGLDKVKSGKVFILDEDITDLSVRKRNSRFISHIPEDRHKHGLVLEMELGDNLALKDYYQKPLMSRGFIKRDALLSRGRRLIEEYDIRSAEGTATRVKSMSGGNQQKAVIARELDNAKPLIIAVQPTRGLDVGAIEKIHSLLVKKRDEGHGILLVSLELDEVMSLSDRIIVIHEGEITGEFLPESTNIQELGLSMAGARKGRNQP